MTKLSWESRTPYHPIWSIYWNNWGITTYMYTWYYLIRWYPCVGLPICLFALWHERDMVLSMSTCLFALWHEWDMVLPFKHTIVLPCIVKTGSISEVQHLSIHNTVVLWQWFHHTHLLAILNLPSLGTAKWFTTFGRRDANCTLVVLVRGAFLLFLQTFQAVSAQKLIVSN